MEGTVANVSVVQSRSTTSSVCSSPREKPADSDRWVHVLRFQPGTWVWFAIFSSGWVDSREHAV